MRKRPGRATQCRCARDADDDRPGLELVREDFTNQVEDLVHVGGATSVAASHFRTLVYAEMVARGTGYAEATAYITMLRMKQPAVCLRPA
jgi:hypothetical protein